MPNDNNISRAIKARLINPDVTLARLVEAGERLGQLDGDISVPTLVGDWYVYHQLTADVKETISSEHLKVLQELQIVDVEATLGALVEAGGTEGPGDKAAATFIGPWYAYKSGVADDLEVAVAPTDVVG
ncbi:hypothetical protein E6C70_05630 [Glaciibacter flavus]|uniref:Uncharacterized protein n=1 Tax=Orlajensenia flava TaxID=2565934 RepID=A0A4S4FZ89_9MICO|nr:hypothetical protein [Glaciibacter flavus]THG35522.1 hypothetical protein E6C70_05630 [Glaciibacter flavus]